MRLIVRGLLAFGLIPASIACGDVKTAGWIPACHHLTTEEAERIITVDGERRAEGEVGGAVAMRAGELHNNRAVWAVVLEVDGTRLVLLHDTPRSVEAPGEEGWGEGRWVSYNAATRHVLLFPLNERLDEPYPDAVVESALRCELSLLPS